VIATDVIAALPAARSRASRARMRDMRAARLRSGGTQQRGRTRDNG
jgi:hypothetical protein